MKKRSALLIVAFLALVVAGRYLGRYLPGFAEWVNGFGPWGAAVFVATYTAACVALAPASLMMLAAGAVFGAAKGVLVAWVAATLGATASFLVARHAARGAVERYLERHATFSALDDALSRQGWKLVILLRLSPIFPYNLLNYALGLSRVSLGGYLVAMLGMIPGTFLLVSSGAIAGDVAAVAGGVRLAHGWPYYAVLGLGIGATVLATLRITRVTRRVLAGT
ncbi:MAG: TVP38/TMEM64 family protein [Gemmatimonadales bacterium]|nr:TVP38/TMEM64 family protein [Gemmatimonadales bacterium]